MRNSTSGGTDMLRKIGVLLIAAAVFFAGRSYVQKQTDRLAQEDGFLFLLTFFRVRLADRVPLRRLYRDFSHKALDACGFTDLLRSQASCDALASALKNGRERLAIDDTFCACLSEFADEIGQVSSAEDGQNCCEKYSRLLEQQIELTRAGAKSRIDVSRKMGVFAALFCIVLFL